jgi:UDP-2-acetamido-2-deoxy-ribo-hexuluronate aminotransferase
MNIDFANLQLQYQKYKIEIDASIHSVLNKSNYIMGDEVQEFERSLEEFTLAKHAITCSSGTDALLLAMMALDIQPGDEIITTPFTFVATAETIALMKAKPVFVDIEYDTFNIDANKIESVITNKTKAIIPVSLYGQPANMEAIQVIAHKHNLKIIIDGAQSFGSICNSTKDSCLGDISATSFFPAKPLGGYGDGGAVFTNNSDYAQKMKMIRVHGQTKRYSHKIIGIGGRLDTIQAAILSVKLSHYNDEINCRNEVAKTYFQELESWVKKPIIKPNRTSVWAQYTVRFKERDLIQSNLKKYGIPTAVHYPMPLHLQECFSYLGGRQGDFPVSEQASNEVLSLPMNPFLTKNEIKYISEKINNIATKIVA